MSELGLMGRDDDDAEVRDDDRPYDENAYYERFTRDGARRPTPPGGRRGDRSGGGRGRRPGRRGGWIPVVVLAVVAALVIGVGYVGFTKVKERLAPPEDYAGPGNGSVLFQVEKGDTASDMAPALADDDVVASSGAFLDAARKDDRSTTIQVGYYPLKRRMSASQALAVLVDPSKQVQSKVTVPEGSRVRDIVKTIVARTDFTKAELTKLLASPGQLGLPAAAKGNPEGYLYPATYLVTPNMDAKDLLTQMVAKSVSVDRELDLATAARKVNLSAEQVLTVASILEYEANRSADYPKVARVIYNRLNKDMPLQLDSTVSYVSGRQGDVWTTAAERDSDSEYNTYKSAGLPPGPIGSPGQETIEAALNPAKGSYLYFVPDFAKGTTLFADTLAQHQKNVAKAQEYCRTHSSC